MPTAQAAAVNVITTGAVYAGPCTFRGFSIASTAGADVVVYDNASAASGTVLAQFTLAAKGFQHVDIADGVRCVNGIYVSTSATLAGHVRVG
jgi:hypothetical protein